MDYKNFASLSTPEFNFQVMGQIAKYHSNKFAQLCALGMAMFPCLHLHPLANQEALYRAFRNAYEKAARDAKKPTGFGDKLAREVLAWKKTNPNMDTAAAAAVLAVKKGGGHFDIKVGKMRKIIAEYLHVFLELQPKLVTEIFQILKKDKESFRKWMAVFCGAIGEVHEDDFIRLLCVKAEQANENEIVKNLKDDYRSTLAEGSYVKVRPVDGNFTRRNASYREAGVL